jgi:predicted PurR-regulated permease PerM
MARLVSFFVLIAILVIISIIFFQVMAGFFVPLFLAALLGVVVQPLYLWTLDKCRGYRHLAAGITTALVALIVLLPIGLVVTTATLEGLSLVDELQLADVRMKLDQLRQDLGLNIPHEQDLRHIEATLHAWREKQRLGETVDVPISQVDNLFKRVTNVHEALKKNAGDPDVLADAEALEDQLKVLRESEPDSIERDDALQHADAEFRKFKRELLGGT